MFLTLVIVFVVAPLIELFVFLQVASWIGALNTILLLMLVSVGGVVIVRHQGLGVARHVRAQLQAGQVPGADLVDGFLILVAGLLLILPGFVTDAIGLVLLLPPTRAFVRRLLRRRFSVRVASRVVKVVNTRGSTTPAGQPDVIEVLPADPRALPPVSPPEPPGPRDVDQ